MSDALKDPNVILDTGIGRMRNNVPADSHVAEASVRVHENLQREYGKVVEYPARISSCADFQALLPAYISSSLSSSRRVLLEDHLHECVHCRKALDEARRLPSGQTARTEAVQRRLAPWYRWAAAGVAAAAVILIAFQTVAVRDFFWPIDVHAMVQTADGALYVAAGQTVEPVAAGRRIEKSQVVRTGAGSRAVLELADGSRIEMNARSEVWLDRARDGVRIHVNRGNILVTAAKQHGGHLYAATNDLGISVVGTVFEVTAGVRGSRVSVLEGEVRVEQAATVRSLHPGQQFSSDVAMASVPLASEVGWSRELSKYSAFLDAANIVAQQAAAIEPRHTSDLVPLIPESTVVFASLPNISQPLAQSYQLFKQRLTENPALADWWQQKGNFAGLGPMLDGIVAHLTTVGSYLGAEVVFAFPANTTMESPVLLADTSAPENVAATLTGMNVLVARSVADLRSFAGAKQPVFYVGDGLMIASSDANQILRSLQFRSQPSLNSFESTALYSKLAQAYTDGIGWLLAADLERLIGNNSAGALQQLMVEQKTAGGAAAYRATLAFNQHRNGIAAWLAEPAPMGALEFISPAAYGVAGVLTKDPLLMFDDLTGILGRDPAAMKDFQNYQAEHHVDIRRDLIATLGNEFVVAIDGPVLPTPGWRMIVEVNDAARLQNTIEWTVAD
ncbi:MAG TPA: FecR family protein, partial [Terriglobia bacterium]|nr:FecR family protein [Terriglobia bacterium]